MSTETLIIVVGGDYLAYEICREILKTAGQRVVLIWRHTDERAMSLLNETIEQFESAFPGRFSHLSLDPSDPRSLLDAGLEPSHSSLADSKYCIVAVAADDRLNLRVALLARDINENVRVTLRQFNPVLGHKIQEGLKHNCTAISPAAHAAATFAAAAVDPSCFYALPFPTLESVVARMAQRRSNLQRGDQALHKESALFAFSRRTASQFDIVGLTVEEAEKRLGVRIIAVDDEVPYACVGGEDAVDVALLQRRFDGSETVAAFGSVEALRASLPPSVKVAQTTWRQRIVGSFSDLRYALTRSEPLLRAVFGVSAALAVAFIVYFAFALHLQPLVALYFVFTTMATVAYGDISPCVDCLHKTQLDPLQVVTIFVSIAMIATGLTVLAVFTATLTATLDAAGQRRLRGLRPIHRSGHVIVCGAGNVGSLVIDYLRDLGERVVVVERDPDALLVELARDQSIDLLTGDATNDETLGFCSPERAKALVGVTNSDTANLELALGARTRRASESDGLHVVLRIDDLAFGHSIDRHFGIVSFSTTELTAPTIAGLARFESTRGRLTLGGGEGQRTFQLAERYQTEANDPPPSPPERPQAIFWIPLYVWREGTGPSGAAIPVHRFDGEVLPGDRLLFIVPLDQFSQGKG